MAFAQYQFRRDTAANWTSANPVLLSGEMGIETDTQKFKLGNGTTAWNSLPYGGIKGDTGATGATGAAGVSPTVSVGATTVVTPATNPSVTDADAGANADLRFSLPRARAVAAGTTTTGAAGTSASVTSATDANGDVSLNFTIPRGDTGATGATGPAGTTPNSFTNIAITGQNTVVADQANDTLTLVAGTNITLTTNDVADSVTIAATIAAQNQFATVSVGTSPTPTLIQADTAADTLTVNAGTGISLTADANTDTFTIVNAAPDQTVALTAGTGITTSGTYPNFTIANAGVTSVTTSSGLSANTNATGAVSITNTGVTSNVAGTGITVSGATGAVTISNAGVTSAVAGTGISVSAATGAVTVTNTLPGYTTTTLAAPTASFSTAVTTIVSQAIAGGSITAGAMYEFYVRAQVVNTITASNIVATVSIGAVNVLVLTQALGTTARAAPGGTVTFEGTISFSSATAAEATCRAFTSTATAFDTALGTTAAVTVATAAATTADIKLNTSAATSTVIVREAFLRRIK